MDSGRARSAFGALILLGLAALGLVSCGIFVSFGDYDTAEHIAGEGGDGLHAVTGTVDGLEGATVTLLLNGGSPVDVAGDGTFAFPAVLAEGEEYAVKVKQDPPRHACTVVSPTTKISAGDATGVAVHCPSTDATLSALTVSAGPLAPAFDSKVLAYAAGSTRVPLVGVGTTIVTATTTSPGARLTIAAVAAKSGTPTPAPLLQRYGPTPSSIDVTVAAADPKTPPVTYTVTLSGVVGVDYLKASNAREVSLFGNAVAVSGDTLVVGAPGEMSNATGVNCSPSPACQNDVSANASGAVYVFTRTGTTWSQQAYIKASNPRTFAGFGAAVAIAGNTLVVGSPGETSNAAGVNCSPSPACQSNTSAGGAGAVYIFTRTGTTWSQQAYVKASNPQAGANFGHAVALAGETLAVGAVTESSSAKGINGNQADTTASGAGAVYVFTRASATWSQQAYIKASNTRVGT